MVRNMTKQTLTTNGEGKSSLYRPVDYKKYDANYDRIFGRKGITYYSKRHRKKVTVPKRVK